MPRPKAKPKQAADLSDYAPQVTRVNESIDPLSVGIEDVPKLTALPRTLVYALVRDGALPSVKVGRRRLVRVKAIDQFLREQEGAAA